MAARKICRARKIRFKEWASRPEAIEDVCLFVRENTVHGHLKGFSLAMDFAYSSLRAWIDAEPARQQALTEARQARSEKLIQEMLEIALSPPKTYVNSVGAVVVDAAEVADRRLTVQACQWTAARLDPLAWPVSTPHQSANLGDPVREMREFLGARA